MDKPVYMAFYKAWNHKHTTFKDRVIATWTRGPYSHVELIVYDKKINKYIMCSALGSCDCVRCKPHVFNNEIYDYIEVKLYNPEFVKEFFKEISGAKYDYKGIILSQIFPLGMDNPNKWFCSESCTKASQISGIDNKQIWKVKPESISPNKLALLLNLIEIDKSVPFYKNINLLFKKNLKDLYKPFNILKINKALIK